MHPGDGAAQVWLHKDAWSPPPLGSLSRLVAEDCEPARPLGSWVSTWWLLLVLTILIP